MKTIPFIGFPLTYCGDLALPSVSTVTHGNNLVHQNSYFLSTSLLPRRLKMLARLNQVDFPSVCCLKSVFRITGLDSFHQHASKPIPESHFFAHTPWELAIYVSTRAQIIHDYLWLQWLRGMWAKLGAFNNPGKREILVFTWFFARRCRKAKMNLVFRAGVFSNNFYIMVSTCFLNLLCYSHVPPEETIFSKWSKNVLMVWIGVEEIIFTAEVAKNKTNNTKEICESW